MFDAMCWGAVLGGAGYTASVGFSEGGFSNWNSGDFWKSVGIGAISGAVTAGIGAGFGTVGSNGFMGEIARAYTHGFANGMISEFTGGDFMSGFVAGGLGSLGGSAFSALRGDFANSMLGQVGFSFLSGGIGAELSGYEVPLFCLQAVPGLAPFTFLIPVCSREYEKNHGLI